MLVIFYEVLFVSGWCWNNLLWCTSLSGCREVAKTKLSELVVFKPDLCLAFWSLNIETLCTFSPLPPQKEEEENKYGTVFPYSNKQHLHWEVVEEFVHCPCPQTHKLTTRELCRNFHCSPNYCSGSTTSLGWEEPSKRCDAIAAWWDMLFLTMSPFLQRTISCNEAEQKEQ